METMFSGLANGLPLSGTPRRIAHLPVVVNYLKLGHAVSQIPDADRIGARRRLHTRTMATLHRAGFKASFGPDRSIRHAAGHASHSCSFDHPRSPEMLRTAIAMAF